MTTDGDDLTRASIVAYLRKQADKLDNENAEDRYLKRYDQDREERRYCQAAALYEAARDIENEMDLSAQQKGDG